MVVLSLHVQGDPNMLEKYISLAFCINFLVCIVHSVSPQKNAYTQEPPFPQMPLTVVQAAESKERKNTSDWNPGSEVTGYRLLWTTGEQD